MSLSLPPPAELERRARRVAFLDALLQPEFALRYFEFNGAWSAGERLFSMRSGEGDHAFAWFGSAGALVRGKHSGKRTIPAESLFATLPSALQSATREPAFELGGDSFATWALPGATAWQSAQDPLKGGMGALLGVLDGEPTSFARYANGYYGAKLDPAALRSFYERSAVTAQWDAVDPVRALALKRELGLPPPRTAKGGRASRSSHEAGDPLGDAEFKVVRDGDQTKLVVGGKIQMTSTRKDAYYEIIEQVRAALRRP